MKVRELGHAVIKVSNRERSEAFYGGVLGMKLAARHETMPMTFYTLGNHHDLALIEVGEEGPAKSDPKAPGLYHLAFCVGDTLDELREVRDELEAAGSRSTQRSTTRSPGRCTSTIPMATASSCTSTAPTCGRPTLRPSRRASR